MRERKRVSLLRELSSVADALDAARVLAEKLSAGCLSNAHDTRRVPELVAAILDLGVARINQLCRAIDGRMDPLHMFAHWNEAYPASNAPEDQDLVLVAWPSKQKQAR